MEVFDKLSKGDYNQIIINQKTFLPLSYFLEKEKGEQGWAWRELGMSSRTIHQGVISFSLF